MKTQRITMAAFREHSGWASAISVTRIFFQIYHGSERIFQSKATITQELHNHCVFWNASYVADRQFSPSRWTCIYPGRANSDLGRSWDWLLRFRILAQHPCGHRSRLHPRWRSLVVRVRKLSSRIRHSDHLATPGTPLDARPSSSAGSIPSQ